MHTTIRQIFAALAMILAGGACSSSGSSGGTGGASGGTGGASGGTGGASGGTGGASGGTGGASGGTGGSGTGGSATGGTGGGATGGTGGGVVCGASGGTPGGCSPSSPIDPCENCIANNCCSERKSCLATNPNDPCGWGPAGGYISEGSCFQHCFKQQLAAGATVSQADATCSTNCVAPRCTTISPATTALMSCLESFCLSECLT